MVRVKSAVAIRILSSASGEIEGVGHPNQSRSSILSGMVILVGCPGTGKVT